MTRLPCAIGAILVARSLLLSLATESCVASETCAPDNDAESWDAEEASLMQTQVKSQLLAKRDEHSAKQDRDLVLVHIGYNFGHTVETVAASVPLGELVQKTSMSLISDHVTNNTTRTDVIDHTFSDYITKNGGEAWGMVYFGVDRIEPFTKCSLYLTPPKYWPEAVAKDYFGNKKRFGIIRDPYEKLVAQFRGDQDAGTSTLYGESWSDTDSCAMNEALKKHLKELKKSGNMFVSNCASVPQAEYFEGPYGVEIPVDNWHFPQSANKLFEEHGYPFHIKQEDIIHVKGCPNSWSKHLDAETRALVRELYKKDFDLLCDKLGYCDSEDDYQHTCLQGVQGMCPETTFTWDSTKELYCPTDPSNLKNVRAREECQ